MIEYVLNDKNFESDAKVILLDKDDKKISQKMTEYFSGDDINLINRSIDKYLNKKDYIKVLGNNAEYVVISTDYAADNKMMQKYGAKIAKALNKSEKISIYAENINSGFSYLIVGIELGSYSFDKYFTKDLEDKKSKIKTINIVDVSQKVKKFDFSKPLTISKNVNFAKDLVNEPANHLNPETFAGILSDLKSYGIKVEIMDEKKLEKIGFNLLLAVARGSENKPRVVVMSWIGNDGKDEYDLTLVGKGVTFDSGGLSIKTGGYMEGMHTDMAGAAVVSGVLKTAGELKLNKNILGIVGLVENMPDGNSYRVNDIITSLSGQTVEVLNTDAEGRLVLADLLTYVQKEYKSDKIVDLATLTGAVSNLFGPVYAGLFCNNKDMAESLIDSGEKTGDRLWSLPLDEYFNKAMDSSYADMQNSGKHRIGGGSQGACFLKRFIEDKTLWAHIDIAGVARESLDDDLYAKGATGYGVKLLVDFLENM